MSITLLFFGVIAAIVLWWLSQQRLTAKPWLEVGRVGEAPDTGVSSLPAAKIGLGVFLAVVGSLFALFLSAYFMRMDFADWWFLPAPRLLWVNTGVLTVASIALEWAKAGVRRGQMRDVRSGLLAGGVATLAFVAGQILAWRQLNAAGHFVATNPANAFFYLLTGVHGLHVLGGVVALGRTVAKARRIAEMGELRLSVELCAMYWHFLLFVWLALFSVLMRWTDDFLVFCRQLLS